MQSTPASEDKETYCICPDCQTIPKFLGIRCKFGDPRGPLHSLSGHAPANMGLRLLTRKTLDEFGYARKALFSPVLMRESRMGFRG